MTEETIVGIFDTPANAEAAIADLRSAGVPERAISVHAETAATTATTTTTGTAAGMTTGAPARETGFWAGLFGGEPDHDTAVYDRSLQNGATVVTVRVEQAHVERVMEILERHGPVDVEERASEYGLTGAAPVGNTAAALQPATAQRGPASGQDTLQLAEEQLQVGKRVVNRGGTRIRRYVVETPVEQDVSLHSEKVTLERHPVTDGRPVTDSFSERTLELTEIAEEAVVSKTARIYEEVGLRKDVTDRVETVRDTVRKEEVEVEHIPGGTTTTTTTNTTTDPVLTGRSPRG